MKAAPRASPRTFGNFPEDIYSVSITKANDSFSSRLIRKLFLPVSLEYSYCLVRPGTSLPLFASIFFLVVTTSSASMRKKPNGQANTFLYVVLEFLFQFFNLKKKNLGRSEGVVQAVLRLMILLTRPQEQLDYKYTPSYSACYQYPVLCFRHPIENRETQIKSSVECVFFG